MADLVEAAKSGNVAKVRDCILRDGCDVNFRYPPDGSTALYWAACNGNTSVCDLLLSSGAEINMATTKSGSTALHGAADREHYECVVLLLRRGSHIDQQTTSNGDTALHFAAYRGNLPICRLLLESGANAKVVNKQGRTALEESQIKKHVDVARILDQHDILYSRQDSLWDPKPKSKSFDFSYTHDEDPFEKEIKSAKSSTKSFDFDLDRLKSADHYHSASASLPSETESTFPSTFTDQSKMTSMASFVGSLDTSGRRFSAGSSETSNETIRNLQMKISALESYTQTLQVELTIRDSCLEQLRLENEKLRKQLRDMTEKVGRQE